MFIGNSVGGFAAARLAITDPQRVSRLVMVNAGGFVTNPAVRLYCWVMGSEVLMKRVLPRSVRSYMKATSDTDHATRQRVLARAKPAKVCSRRATVAQFRLARLGPAPAC